MKQYLLFGMCLALCSLNVLAGDKIDKVIEVAQDGVVDIHNVRGQVKIIGWDEAKVQVKGTLDDLAEEFIFVNQGNTTTIKVKLPRNSRHHSRKGSNLVVNVPKKSTVAFSGVATDLDVSQVEGGVEIKSVSGNIAVNDVQGSTFINNISGGVKLKNISGALEVSTISGDLDADVRCDKVKVRGVSADLKLKLQKFQSAKLSNVSGDTLISGTLDSNGELDLGSVSGKAIYMVEGDLDAEISMETAPGGDIVNEYSNDKPISSFIKSNNLKFTAGEGKGKVKMSTVSGDVGLKTPVKAKDKK